MTIKYMDQCSEHKASFVPNICSEVELFRTYKLPDRLFKVDIFWKIWDRIIPSSGPYIFRWWLYILSQWTFILSRPYFFKDRILTILDRIFYRIIAMATFFLDFRIL